MLTRMQAIEFARTSLQDSPLVLADATRNDRFGLWIVGYRDADEPDVRMDGGGVAVTDEGEVYDLGSAPGSLDDLMIALGRWPGQKPSDAYPRDGESRALLPDLDPAEAEGLTALDEARNRERKHH